MSQGQPKAMTIDEQIAAVSKLKELLDAKIQTQEEFDAKKKNHRTLSWHPSRVRRFLDDVS